MPGRTTQFVRIITSKFVVTKKASTSNPKANWYLLQSTKNIRLTNNLISLAITTGSRQHKNESQSDVSRYQAQNRVSSAGTKSQNHDKFGRSLMFS